MDDGDGRINALTHEQERHRFSDDHTAAEHNNVGAGEGDRACTEQAQATEWSTRNKTRLVVERELGDVEWVKSVDVFAWIECAHDCRLVDLWRWRWLNKNTVDFLVVIELVHPGEQFLLRCRRGQFEFHRMKTKLAAHFVFGPHIG